MDQPKLRRGLLVILSSPSGAGKTTLSRLLVAADPAVAMSVSATTRPKRAGERDGIDYRFVDEQSFRAMAAAGEFLEWARVFDHFYGTPAAPVDAALAAGSDILFDIDWQGTQALAQARKDDVVSIFILPPSMAELERRLRSRGTDSAEVIAGRMRRAADEISHWAEYDYVLINADAQQCLAEIRTILAAERLRRRRHGGLVEFVRTLLG